METMDFETLPLFSKPHFSWRLQTDYVGRRLIYRPETESTMDDAHRMLERFRLTNGALLLAETQTAGRGRAGRAWVSPPDVNLYCTIVVTPSAEGVRCLPYVTPLAVAQAVEEIASAEGVSLHAALKWPNDVQIDGRKIAGVLVESTSAADETLVAFVGAGINVNLDVEAHREISSIATSIKREVGVEVYREEVLASFCNHFEALYEAASSGDRAPFESWRSRLINLGREVTAHGPREDVQGIAVDVTEDGALVIERADGRRVTVEAGDVSLTHAF